MSEDEGMKPRLLLVEDDPISRAFMSVALEALPAQVDSADCIAEALRCEQGHALWLIDANLPDGSGAELLEHLRQRGLTSTALAHTADASVSTRQSLLTAGFAAVLIKPLPALELQAAIRAHLPVDPAHTPDWDEAIALNALNGQHKDVALLRQLFIHELPAALRDVENAFQQGDAQALSATLHKLQASCGFVGAMRLAAAVKQLQAALTSPPAMHEFRSAALALLG